MFVLPLVPALVELRRKSDALPLSVVQQNAGEIRYFSDSFRAYINGLEPIMQGCVAAGTTATGALPDGEEYVVLGRVDEPLLLALQQRDTTHLVMGSDVDLILPAGNSLAASRTTFARFWERKMFTSALRVGCCAGFMPWGSSPRTPAAGSMGVYLRIRSYACKPTAAFEG